MNDKTQHISATLHRPNLSRVVFGSTQHYRLTLLEYGKLYFAGHWAVISRPTLVFSKPQEPLAWEPNAETDVAYTCSFDHDFMASQMPHGMWRGTPFLDESLPQVLTVEAVYANTVRQLFELMEKASHDTQMDDTGRVSILASALHVVLHIALNGIHSAVTTAMTPQPLAAQRTAEFFLLLLDEQFPVDYPQHQLQLRSAKDFAQRLSVHVNHLNRVIKTVTGKTTTELISSRICNEAITMLQGTSLTIAEIAYALGFEEPASFSSFIRRHTGKQPSAYRKTE